MTSQNAEKNLLSSVSNRWRSSVEKSINSLKKSSNREKREKCIEEILQILCCAIIQDRDEVCKRSKKRRESIEWWSSFIKDNTSFFFVVIVGGYFIYEICQVASSWFEQLKAMPVSKDAKVVVISLIVVFIVIFTTFTLVGAKKTIKPFFKWILKYFGL